MTISTTSSSVTAAGNGATTAFNFSFIAGTASNVVVTLTDATSNSTVLVQGSQYTLLINSPVAGQIWGVGGSVTYPLSGAPTPAGSYLTITRLVPFTQLTSISNQGDFYPQAVERALDTLEMQVQQVASAVSRAIVVNPADENPPTPLPIASVRANQYLVFDSNGNPTTGAPVSGATVSSAMQPVVGASTIPEALLLERAIRYFSTIAALRVNSGVGPSAVWVEGYYAGSDGGEGLFYSSSTDTTSADNGGTIIVDTSGTRWYRAYNKSALNVLWFGADPSAIADSQPAFANALAVSGNIFVPAGKYKLNSALAYTLPNGAAAFTMTGAGPDATTLYWPSGQGLTVNFPSASNTAHIRDMTFTTATAGAGSRGLLLNYTGTSYVITSALTDVTNCTFRGDDGYIINYYWDQAVKVVAVNNVDFTNVSVSGPAPGGSGYTNVGTGVYLEGSTAHSFYGVVYNFYGCLFNYLASGVLYGDYIQGVTLTQCNFTGGTNGVVSYTSETGTLDQLSVMGCQINVAFGGVIMETFTSAVTITNNLFIVPAGAFGVSISSNTFTVVGNVFDGGSTVNAVGINITGGTGGSIDANSFSNLSSAITLEAASSGNVVGPSNSYVFCTTTVADLGTNNVLIGKTFSGLSTQTLSGATPTIAVPVPLNYFQSEPTSAFLMQTDPGSEELIGYYQRNSSTATALRFTVVRRDGGSIASAAYTFCYTAFT